MQSPNAFNHYFLNSLIHALPLTPFHFHTLPLTPSHSHSLPFIPIHSLPVTNSLIHSLTYAFMPPSLIRFGQFYVMSSQSQCFIAPAYHRHCYATSILAPPRIAGIFLNHIELVENHSESFRMILNLVSQRSFSRIGRRGHKAVLTRCMPSKRP